ncbi:hypothetical protein KOW79_012053 [Hemibagrus wyckioides]|uniref:Uncharacterized protein n=2 Tax=Hemibagrus wyckioides TaxID=337641 RepID=A0A9D3SH59_9TELE|nr:uncharacterized protein si:ch211-106e7.2 isoform X2 [Hemibagrus wyckioides]XP_058264483.1 uncharacterized protein si:ch211-106e7.2 isoform X2 [Hemibagrus wyckioides]XP_058264484.1 uncharacterized protein si:ch211-106e7.2 isoform X2 [Hemibagrus wyckioides]XP_058264485.1 uncharacterized protein si:ch211-106e7.2 isoform X2 [Hemibagrus wyckioides]XP_058264486.1 uncharacterized protein si:ch211-106e7.2 isoform X2 [Hemibagrus wyckioides]KAG7324037.1 hypothetical protein KOW79_012053 [Hemibagrus w
MEKLDGSGLGTSSHLSQTSNYIAVPLDTVLKDQKFLSYKVPTALESGWNQKPPSLQTSNVQILAHCQHNNESYLRQSTLSTRRPTGQIGNHGFTAVIPRDNYPQHKSQRFCSNDRPPEIPATSERVLLRQCPVQSSSSSSIEHQKASSASTSTNSSQQSHMPLIVQKTSNLSESSQNSLYNQQQRVKITNNLPKDSVCQGSFANVAVILSQAQPIMLQTSTNERQTNDELHQQNACMPKEIYQQKYATQKAIAVVTPLTQTAVVGVTLSNSAKEKVGGPETRAVPNKNDHRPYIPHICQSTTTTFQAKEVPSVQASEISHCVKDDKPVKNNQLVPGENLPSVSHNSVSVERREVLQQSPANCSAQLFSEHDATLMSRNPVGTKPTMDPRMDKLSTAPVQEWSLQRLRNFITQMEQTQRRQQKNVPNDDIFNEILKLYWNGDYRKLCDAAKSSLYTDIMKDVRLHYQTESSVILQGVLRERLNEIASSFYILEHGYVPPKMGYRSSWLNLSENLNDIPSEHYDLSLLMTLHCKQTKTPDQEVPVKEMSENMSEPTTGKRKAFDKALSERKKQKKALPPKHQENSVRKEPVGVNVENTSSGKETEGQNSTNVENVTVENKVQSEQQNQTESENQAPLLESLSTQASDVSDHCTKPRILIKLLTTDTTPVSDKNGSAYCVSVKKSILPPEKAEEPDVEVNNMSKEDAPSLTDSSQDTVESLEQDKICVDVEIKSDELRNGIELEKYCCLPKWLQVLGYQNGGLCKCEKTSELSHQADASSKGVKEVNIEKNRHPFNKACELTGTELKEARNKPSPVVADDDSMDELEIVDVITDYEDVLELANAVSEQVTSHESPSGRDHHQEITRAEFKTRETLINLTLFGTSHARQKKNISGFMSSDKVPPETLNVRIGSGWNRRSDSSKGPKSHTPKQQVWNSWKKTHVSSKRSTNTGSKNQKPAKAPESKKHFCLTSANKPENTNRDQSKKKSRKKISLTRQDQIRKLKRNKLLASFNLKKRWNYANHGRKLTKTSFDSSQVINPRKNKLDTGLALNFGVLPESFNISDGSSSEKAKQPASAESSSEVKSVVQTKRTWGMSGTWCESPRKKQCLKSTPTLPNSSRFSTFQEFKKKYEEKKQKTSTQMI